MAKRKTVKNSPGSRVQSPKSKVQGTGQGDSGLATQDPSTSLRASSGLGTDLNWPRDLNTRLDRLGGAELEVCVEMGRRRMSLEQIVNFEPGNVIELEKLSGMPMEIFVNGTLFGRGEVVVVGDSLAIRITELLRTE